MSLFRRWAPKSRSILTSGPGARPRLQGRADIGGGGKILIGNGFAMRSRPVRSHIFASPGAVITIGNNVQISYGAAIAAAREVEIGDNCSFGPFVVIMDNDFHKVGDRHAAGEVAPVHIGSRVSVGARVTILRGSVIGDDVHITSGSMVSGVLPKGAAVSGVPARIIDSHRATDTQGVDVAGLVQSVLGLAERPLDSEGPEQIGAWDSLGSLRLLLAIEERYNVTLTENEMHAGNTVAALSDIIAAKL
jgi:acetyltransferase-like isoleucine patch superfamily enzyme/acyl carrier protein